jgi:plastocyanin
VPAEAPVLAALALDPTATATSAPLKARAAVAPRPTRAAPRKSPTPAPRAATKAQVTIKAYAFGPAAVKVPVGSTVVWVNQDPAQHTVTNTRGAFDSGMIKSGGTFSMRFTKPGTYAFFCQPHPWMQGTITVTGQ